MELKDIKYKGEKINEATMNSEYQLLDHKLECSVYTGSYRQCWIRREYLSQWEDISNFEIVSI